MAKKKHKEYKPWVRDAFIITYIVLTGLVVIYTVYMMVTSTEPAMLPAGIAVLVLSAASLVLSAGILRKKEWARKPIVGVLAPGSAVFAIFAVFFVLSIVGVAPKVEQVVPFALLPFFYFVMLRCLLELLFLLAVLGKVTLSQLAENLNVFLSAYAIAFVIRTLLVEAYQIPSQSMVPSLLVKDILLVEKATCGTIIPIAGWKLPGFMPPRRNDIMVFVSPAWKSPGLAQEAISLLTLSLVNLDNTFDTPKNLVKRVVGLPGDRLMMSNRVLFINGRAVETEYLYSTMEEVYDRMVRGRDQMFQLFTETMDNKTRIVQRYFPDDITNQILMDSRSSLVFNFAEIYVPRKGDVIRLADATEYYKSLLKLLIERESGKTVELRDGRFYLEGAELKEWKAANSYYFGMGDNRDFSEDCRYFGFIPEKNIFGKPFFRYFPFTRLGFDVSETAGSISNHFTSAMIIKPLQ